MKRALAVVASLLLAVGPTLAHTTGTEHQETPSLLPPTVFLAGVLVLGTAVVLDHYEELTRRQANAGVGVGVVGVLAGIALLFF